MDRDELRRLLCSSYVLFSCEGAAEAVCIQKLVDAKASWFQGPISWMIPFSSPRIRDCEKQTILRVGSCALRLKVKVSQALLFAVLLIVALASFAYRGSLKTIAQ